MQEQEQDRERKAQLERINAYSRKYYPEAVELSFDADKSVPGFFERRVAARWNMEAGTLSGYDCPLCRNKGWIRIVKKAPYGVDIYSEVAVPCQCKPQRLIQRRIDQSGLSNAMYRMTFDSYNAKAAWQASIRNMAAQFWKALDGSWFYIGGQPGSGKTHICTAMCNKLITAGNNVRYMPWTDEAKILKAVLNTEEYGKLMQSLKTVKVLYIDDLFKTRGGQTPTDGDVNIATEIIYARYNNDALTTIISSERSLNEIIAIDEGLGSRILERTGDYNITISPDKDKNLRGRRAG